ncbi:MAG: hypothetical protein NC092_13210 [Butyrivibrio sp.]|nr:hypothetical protein [Muribaculum sp.]MCM1553630.1 hypothetical protein [Butyrivibrio sp.]
MKTQEVAIYREIQRNAETAIKALDTLADKVYDKELAMQISRQSLKYAGFRGEAVQALLDAKAEPYHANQLTDMVQRTGIHYNTLLNTSTGHIAELMIRERNQGTLELERVLKHNEDAGEKPRTLAKELLDYDQKSITTLKSYL